MWTRLATRVRQRLRRGSLARDVSTLVAGTAGAQILVVITSPIITRVYAPAELGAFAAATAIVSITLTFACLSYQIALPLPDEGPDAASLFVLCLVISLAMTGVFGVGVLLVGTTMLGLLDADILAPYLPLLVVSQLFGGVLTAGTAWCIRNRLFGAVATNRVIQTGSLVGTQIAAGATGFGAVGLLLGDVARSVVGAAGLLVASARARKWPLTGASIEGMRRMARRYRRFPIYTTPSSMINAIGGRAPLILMITLFGIEVGGLYALAERVVSVPVALLANSMSQVFFAEAARQRAVPGALRVLFWRTTRGLARIGTIPVLVLGAVAPFAFGLLFGSEWSDAGLYTALLTPMMFMSLVMSSTGAALGVVERQDLQALREVLRVGMLATAALVAAALSAGPLLAVALISAAGSLTYVGYGYLSWRAIDGYERGRLGAIDGD